MTYFYSIFYCLIGLFFLGNAQFNGAPMADLLHLFSDLLSTKSPAVLILGNDFSTSAPVMVIQPVLVGVSAHRLFPDNLLGIHNEINFLVDVKPDAKSSGGFLFSIVQPDMSVFLGVTINRTKTADDERLNEPMYQLQVVYPQQGSIKTLYGYMSPDFFKQKTWNIYIKISSDRILVSTNCFDSKEPMLIMDYTARFGDLNFPAGSLFYLFSGGPKAQGYFQGTATNMVIFYARDLLDTHCNNLISNDEGSGNGENIWDNFQYIYPKFEGNYQITTPGPPTTEFPTTTQSPTTTDESDRTVVQFQFSSAATKKTSTIISTPSPTTVTSQPTPSTASSSPTTTPITTTTTTTSEPRTTTSEINSIEVNDPASKTSNRELKSFIVARSFNPGNYICEILCGVYDCSYEFSNATRVCRCYSCGKFPASVDPSSVEPIAKVKPNGLIDRYNVFVPARIKAEPYCQNECGKFGCNQFRFHKEERNCTCVDCPDYIVREGSMKTFKLTNAFTDGADSCTLMCIANNCTRFIYSNPTKNCFCKMCDVKNKEVLKETDSKIELKVPDTIRDEDEGEHWCSDNCNQRKCHRSNYAFLSRVCWCHKCPLDSTGRIMIPQKIVEGTKGEKGTKGEVGDPGVCNIYECQSAVKEELRIFNAYQEMLKEAKIDVKPNGENFVNITNRKGDIGLPGIDGTKGDIGLPGIDGAKGDMGLPGIDGAKGDIGLPGIDGAKGDIGLPGIDGAKGDMGLPGIDGSDGKNGITGAKGDKGDVGLTGDTASLEKTILEILKKPDIRKQLEGYCNCTSTQLNSESDKTQTTSSTKSTQKNHKEIFLTTDIYESVKSTIFNKQNADAEKYRNYNTITVSTRADLEDIAYILPIGSTAFVLNKNIQLGVDLPDSYPNEPQMFIKIAEIDNMWREIKLDFENPIKLSKEQRGRSAITPIPFKEVQFDPLNPKLYMIISPNPWHGSIRSSEVQIQCQREAEKRNLPGVFYPFLTYDANRIVKIMPSHLRRGVPIVNLNNQILFNDWNSLIRGAHITRKVPLLTFDGYDILRRYSWLPRYLWIGANINRTDSWDMVDSCNMWTTLDPMVTGLAIDLSTSQFLNRVVRRQCSNSYYVACIQTSLD